LNGCGTRGTHACSLWRIKGAEDKVAPYNYFPPQIVGACHEVITHI
jgi:hypothetical protein